MYTVTSFPADAAPRDQLRRILADYLALDRARIFRRLMVRRCSVLALLAALWGIVVTGLTPFGRWMPAGLCLTGPGYAWIIEMWLQRRLARRLAGVDGKVTHEAHSRGRAITGASRKKVIKSS
jgi:hypothetical protein